MKMVHQGIFIWDLFFPNKTCRSIKLKITFIDIYVNKTDEESFVTY